MRTVCIGDVKFQTSDRHHEFWSRCERGDWEPDTFRVLDKMLEPASLYIDVGAWIGPTLLYAATRAAIVYGFEPDPIAFAELKDNISLNPQLDPRIVVHNCGLGKEDGEAKLFVGGLVPSIDRRLGDSTSGMIPVAPESQEYLLVRIVSLATFFAGLDTPRCDVMKLDIEGYEHTLLPAISAELAQRVDALLVSFHAPAPERRQQSYTACARVLHESYSCIYDVTGQPIDFLKRVRDVRDWSDESAGSDWCHLDEVSGRGIIATNRHLSLS